MYTVLELRSDVRYSDPYRDDEPWKSRRPTISNSPRRQGPAPKKNKNRGRKPLAIALLVLAVTLIGGLTWYFAS